MVETSDRPQLGAAPTSSQRRDLALLIGLTLGLHLPFIDQAFHIDDVIFLSIARNLFQNPLFPLDQPFIFEGRHYTLWGFSHPPLNGYLIAAVLLFKRAPSEWLLHAVYLLFPLLATISFYFLGKRFAKRPLLATALFATVPTLVVMSHNLMADVPLLAFWLSATALFVYAVDRGAAKLECLAALPLIAASCIAYQGLALVPLLGFYALQRRRFTKRVGALLALPVALLLAWQAMGYLHRGSPYASTMFAYLAARGLWWVPVKLKSSASLLGYLGGAILLFPWLFVAFGRRWRGLFLFSGLAAGLAGVLADYRMATNYSLAQKAFFALCFAGGFVTTFEFALRLLEGVLEKRHNPDVVFLCLWFLGVLFYCVVIFISSSARYLLPAAPPLVLLLVRTMDACGGGSKPWRAFYAALLPCQLVLGLALAQADYEFAGIYRRFARDFQRHYLSAGETFLFSGEWGFRYYLGEIGGQPMANDTVARPGELFVESKVSPFRFFYTDVDRSLVLVERRVYRGSSPLRLLLDPQARTGFWSNAWGVMPFWFSNLPLDEITICRVRSSYQPSAADLAAP